MKKYAQIIHGQVHWVGEFKKLPLFHSSIVFVEITNESPMPQEGWMYDGATFSPSDGKSEAKNTLDDLDRTGSFNKVGENLIDLLISKGIISLNELLPSSQDEINKRKQLRAKTTKS